MSTRNLIIFFSGWFLLNGIQAYFTNLTNDEAYYWVYSLRLDWGYFDHPPVVALFVRLGYLFFNNEFGVRLITILSQIAALLLIYRYLLPAETKEKRSMAIVIVMALIPILHVFAFIATPDAPVFLTAVVFLILYKKFLSDNSWINSLLLGVSMALMLYSKYHGILIIGFIILSNPKILLDYKFWAGSMFGACLFIPHLVWQYVNEFPSLKYHLVDRNKSFEFKVFWIYLVNQLINFNPVILVIVIVNLFRSKIPVDKFERGLVFLFIGFLGFFLIMTFRGHIEPQWTYVLVIPIIILVMKYATETQLRAVLYSGLVVVPLLILGRLFLVFDVLPIANEFHGYPLLSKEIQHRANGLPVFILNSYQLTAKYHFYTQERAYGLSSGGRRNQYDIWKDEEQFFGKRIYAVSRYPRPEFEEINVNGPYGAFGRVVDDFAFYKEVSIDWKADSDLIGGIFSDTLQIVNPYLVSIDLAQATDIMMFVVNDENKRTEIELSTDTKFLPAKSTSVVVVTSKEPVPPGQYSIMFGLKPVNQFFSINSSAYPVVIP